jgi:hypothetical protein
MPSIELNLNIFYIIGMVVLAFLAGFFLRRYQKALIKKKFEQLENEIRINYADILELQKEKAALEIKIRQSPPPFIPKENESEKLPDSSPRMKLVPMEEINSIREHGTSSTV